MSRPDEILWCARGIANRLDCSRPFASRNTRSRGPMIHWNRKTSPQRRGVFANHRMQVEPLADLRQDRHAELPTAVGDHEVHSFGGRLFSRTYEVAFVFPIFGIDNNDNPPGANRLNGLFDSGEMLVQWSLKYWMARRFREWRGAPLPARPGNGS